MYRVVLADDEAPVLRGLQKYVDWKRLDCEVAATATDGESALRVIYEHKPEIVIIDIMMPGRSGLEIIRECRKSMNIQFIIFSGYSEFDFAKEAIQLETVDYLLKPMNIGEIEKAIRRAQKRYLDNHFLTVSGSSEVNIVKQQIVYLLNRIDANAGALTRFGAFVVLVLQGVPGAGSDATDAPAAQIASLDTQRCMVSMIRSGEAVILACCAMQKEDTYRFLYQSVKRLKASQQQEEASFFWGMGGVYYEADMLACSYEEANEMLNYAMFTREQLESISVLRAIPSDDYNLLIERAITCVFGSENDEALSQVIDALFMQMLYEKLPIEAMQDIGCKLVYTLRSRAEHEYAGFIKRDTLSLLSASAIMNRRSIGEMKTFLNDALEATRACYTSAIRQSSKSSLMLNISTYVEAHIDQPITLAEIAAHVNMNPSYVSHCFKKETGQNLFDYIADIKMEHARKLIEQKQLMVYEVAHHVGYNDQGYFSQVFKKRTGMTALEYRDRQK